MRERRVTEAVTERYVTERWGTVINTRKEKKNGYSYIGSGRRRQSEESDNSWYSVSK